MARLAEADVVYTDTWVSMGQEVEVAQRNTRFAPYYLSAAAFAKTRSHTIFMNDMPIRRGIEVDDAVVDSSRSVIYEQAENRIYMQMAIIENLISN
jgi:ornithine carbamoyltransferase